jgi:simple sugar transport system permease protein
MMLDVPVGVGALAVGASLLEATVRTATPLAYAALGESVSERAGVINIGLEGSIIAGALSATIAAGAVGVGGGFAAGAVAGLLVAALFALGLTGTVYRTVYGSGGVALDTPTAAAYALPGLSALPLIGRAFFAQPLATYALYVIAPLLAWWMQRTHAGLALRAVGEYPTAAIAAGISPTRTQLLAVLFAGAMAGLAGATIVLAQAGTFVEGMSAGRGFIAIAIVVLGRWRPMGVAAAALLFGAATSLQTLFQSMGWTGIPYQLFLAVPYVLTLVVLAVTGKRGARRVG